MSCLPPKVGASVLVALLPSLPISSAIFASVPNTKKWSPFPFQTLRMSAGGIEVAGLVLGAFPIALEVLDRYKEVAKRFRFWYKIAAEHKKCDSQIKYQRLVYIHNLKSLLLPLAGLDDVRIDELINDPGGTAWADAEVTRVLRRRLADSYELYLQFMDDFKESLDAMNRELAFDPATRKQCPPASSSTVSINNIDIRTKVRIQTSRG